MADIFFGCFMKRKKNTVFTAITYTSNQLHGTVDKFSIHVFIQIKYVKDHNFGGITAWAIDLDDFSGMCGQGKYPLLNAIKYELSNSTGTTGKYTL